VRLFRCSRSDTGKFAVVVAVLAAVAWIGHAIYGRGLAVIESKQPRATVD